MPDFISVDQLQLGIYIHLDMHWMNHPFSFGSFKIKSEDQIQTIRQLGLKKVRYDPARSESRPLSLAMPPSPTSGPETEIGGHAFSGGEVIQEKLESVERLNKFRDTVARVEKNYLNAANTVKNIQKNLHIRPRETVAEAEQFVAQLVEEFLADTNVTIHAMGSKPGTEDTYYHSLNVTILSLMVAKELDLPADQAAMLGQGALFHDIGLKDVPSRILLKTDPLTNSERNLREMHCDYGVKLGQPIGLPQEIIDIIQHHHELLDGTGYPQKLKGDKISLLARIVAAVNQYDNLCNPVNVNKALTPHEALSYMFAQQRGKFDDQVMKILVRCLGVYPPGTIVALSNDFVAMVMAVNSAKPLRPILVVHNQEIPREEAIVLDLQDEPDINITKAIRPAMLSREVLAYLSVRQRVSYYFDASQP